jgi:hypothetical protein
MDLKIMVTIVLAEVPLPLTGTNSCLCTFTDNNVASMDHTVKSPTEHADVVPICTNAG